MSTTPAAPGDGEQNDDTASAAPEDTVIVPRSTALVPDDDDTVSVSDAAPQEDTDPTVLVERESSEDPDDTVLVDEEATVHVPRQDVAADAEPTADAPAEIAGEAVGGAPDSSTETPGPGAVVSAVAKPAMAPASGRRRGELRPAPVPSGFGGLPVVAPGPGAVEAYRPRRLPPPPRRGESTATPEPPRRLTGAVSVARRSRTASVVAIASFSASFVVLAGLLVWAVKELAGL